MALHKIEKGLDLPIPGKPLQVVRESTACTRVAVMADDELRSAAEEQAAQG